MEDCLLAGYIFGFATGCVVHVITECVISILSIILPFLTETDELFHKASVHH